VRKVVRKLKLRQTVALPPNLVWFLMGVDQMIRERHDSVVSESDDLIQGKRAVGGLVRKGRPDFYFTYFPDKRGIRNKWQLTLNRRTISDIARAKRKSLRLWACRSPRCGWKFTDSKDTCFYCDYEDAV
jgi:hypothetical protein